MLNALASHLMVKGPVEVDIALLNVIGQNVPVELRCQFVHLGQRLDVLLHGLRGEQLSYPSASHHRLQSGHALQEYLAAAAIAIGGRAAGHEPFVDLMVLRKYESELKPL